MAKSWKNVTSDKDIETISVTLRPRFGLEPVVYVPVIWLLLLLGVLFLVLILPGMRSYGTLVSVDSSPSGAQVFVDGELRGATPVETFVEAGNGTIEVRLAGFEPIARQLAVRGRRIGSALFPLRRREEFVFEQPDVTTIHRTAVEEFSRWALGPEPGTQFQHPPVARDGARRLWAGSRSRSNDDRYIQDLAAHATEFQAAELLGAALRVKNPGGVLNAASIAAVVQNFIQLDTDFPGFHGIIEELARPGRVDSTSWYRSREDRLSTDLLVASVALDEGEIPASRSRMIAGIPFVNVPAGTYAIGYPLRDQHTTGVIVNFETDFWIQAAETTRGSFARFVAETDQWSPENRDEDDYLKDWPGNWTEWLEGVSPEDAKLPVRYVTRDAANAYAHWLGGRSELRDHEKLRLPNAAEWEYAAFLNDSGRPNANHGELVSADQQPMGALGARALAGNLWEWTGDWYGRHSHILPADHGSLATVIGGSYANDTPAHNMRGGQATDRATPFLGFRLVFVPHEDREGR